MFLRAGRLKLPWGRAFGVPDLVFSNSAYLRTFTSVTPSPCDASLERTPPKACAVPVLPDASSVWRIAPNAVLFPNTRQV